MKLPTEDIPYEIRRNPLQISLFKNTKIVDHKLILDQPVDKALKSFVVKSSPTTPTTSYKYVYVYRTMSLDNYGHFIIDNLIPLYKMIVLTQGYDFNRDDVLFCFLKAPKETVKQQAISEKQNKLLEAFSSHPIRFIEEMPDIAIDNLVVPFLGLGTSISFCKWQEYKHHQLNEQISSLFLQNFRKHLLDHFQIQIKAPNKRVFLSRKKAKHRKVLNEDAFTAEHQILPVTFENKTIQEELQLFSDAAITVTPYGAGIVGSFFQQPQSRCIIIHPNGFDERYDFPQIYTLFLKRLDVNVQIYHSITGKPGSNIFRNRDSHIRIDLNDFNKKLNI